MKKKIEPILECFQAQQYEQTLRKADQLLKKISKDEKKKSNLQENDLSFLYLLKCGSLGSLGKLHQGHKIFQQNFTKGTKIEGEFPKLFANIARLIMHPNFHELLQRLQNNKVKDSITDLQLSDRSYIQVSKYFLKEYAENKKINDGLAHVYLMYLSSADVQYSVDGLIKPEPTRDLKMTNMFLHKLVNNSKDATKVIKSAIGQLRLKIAIKQNLPSQARNIYNENEDIIPQIYRYLNSIRDLTNQKDQNGEFYICKITDIFRRNLNLANYIPLYEYYNQFLSYLIGLNEGKIFIPVRQTIPIENLYLMQHIKAPELLLNKYYISVLSEYRSLVAKENQNAAKSDYYKICLKGLLLQILRMQLEGNKQQPSMQILQYLSQYQKYFGATLTFISEIQPYWKDLQTIKQSYSRADQQLISDINIIKLTYIKNQPTSKDDLLIALEELHKKYRTSIVQFQKQRGLQIGEKYLSDQIAIVAVDLVRTFTNNYKLDHVIRQQLWLNALEFLQGCILKSPFNADLKIRIIDLCFKLSYFEIALTTIKTMDLKSIQLQTLGHLVIRTLLEGSLSQQNEELLNRMFRCYHQNSRQTSQYALKALKNGSLGKVDEFLCFGQCIQNSFSLIMLLFMQYMRTRRQQNTTFYLQKIKTILSNGVYFNCDPSPFNNHLQPQYTYYNFYGVYCSVKVMTIEVDLRIIYHKILNQMKTIEELEIKNLRTKLDQLSRQDLFNLHGFKFSTKKIQINYSQESLQHQIINQRLQNYKKIVSIFTECLQISNNIIRKQVNSENRLKNIQNLIEEYKIFFKKQLNWRQQIQIINLNRIYLIDCIHILQNVIQHFKKIENKQQIKLLIECLFQSLIATNPSNDYQLTQRDDVIRKINTIDNREVKKLVERTGFSHKMA